MLVANQIARQLAIRVVEIEGDLVIIACPGNCGITPGGQWVDQAENTKVEDVSYLIPGGSGQQIAIALHRVQSSAIMVQPGTMVTHHLRTLDGARAVPALRDINRILYGSDIDLPKDPVQAEYSARVAALEEELKELKNENVKKPTVMHMETPPNTQRPAATAPGTRIEQLLENMLGNETDDDEWADPDGDNDDPLFQLMQDSRARLAAPNGTASTAASSQPPTLPANPGAAASSLGGGSDQLLLQLLICMVTMMKKGRSGSGDPDLDGIDGMRVMKALSRARMIKQAMQRNPLKYIEDYLAWWTEVLNAEGTYWNWTNTEKAIPFDLECWFFQLAPEPEFARSNAVGRRLRGVDYEDPGAKPGVNYRMCLAVLAMGGQNSMDLAQEIHEFILVDSGCLLPPECLRYRVPELVGDTWEGAYCDDHFVVQQVPSQSLTCLRQRPCPSCPRCAGQGCWRRDEQIVEQSVKGYDHHCVLRSLKKAVRFELRFTIVGTEVDGVKGRCSAEQTKLRQLSRLLIAFWSYVFATFETVRLAFSNTVHPFQHAKYFNAFVHRSFKYMQTMSVLVKGRTKSLTNPSVWISHKLKWTGRKTAKMQTSS